MYRVTKFLPLQCAASLALRPTRIMQEPLKTGRVFSKLAKTLEEVAMPKEGDQVLSFTANHILTKKEDSSFFIPFSDLCPNPTEPSNQRDYFFLGEHNGKRTYVASCEDRELSSYPALKLTPARDVLASADEKTARIISRAKHLGSWHRSSFYCGDCGSPTKLSQTEVAKVCQDCKKIIYPTTSPIVMVLVEKDGKILLARSPHFGRGLYSILAGFVGPGESYEEAAHREVAEETGIKIKNLAYFSSQAWPFPSSLAVAFKAEYASGEITPDTKEIEDAQWFDPSKLPGLPHPCSISRAIIDDYIKESET